MILPSIPKALLWAFSRIEQVFKRIKLGSFVGYIYEVLFEFIESGTFVNRGFYYGYIKR